MNKVITLGSILVGMVFLAGCSLPLVSKTQPTTPANETTGSNKSIAEAIYEPAEPISYSILNIPVQIITEVGVFNSADSYMEAIEQNCSANPDPNFFNKLADKFINAKKIYYHFKYIGNESANPEGSNDFVVTLLENKVKYSSLAEFKKDFDACGVGFTYPAMLNDRWLLFESPCSGAGPSGPVGCELVREAVEPTLKLK